MRTSLDGRAAIIGHEAIVPMPYRDSKGVWTYMIGHTAAAGPPDPATLPRGEERPIEEGLKLFAGDIVKYENEVSRAVTVPVAQHEFDALVSFHLNTGGIAYATLTKKLNAGDRAGAAAAFMNWGAPPEIVPRRRAEMELFKSGRYGAGSGTVYLADAAGKLLWGSGRRIDTRALLSTLEAEDPRYPVLLLGMFNSDAVRELQQLLNRNGAALDVDGDFGPLTRRAVETFQGDVEKGVVGRLTWTALRA